MAEACFLHVKNFFHPYLLPLKAVFFLQIGATACLIPYIPLFLQHLGLNEAENGIVFGVLPFIAMLSKPSAGALSDKFKVPFLLLRCYFAVQLIFSFSIYFIPQTAQPIVLPSLSNLSCLSDGFSPQPERLNLTHGNFTCDTVTFANVAQTFIFPDYSELVALTKVNYARCNCSWDPFPVQVDSSIIRWTLQFWLTGLLLIFGWFGYGGAVTLTDAIAFRVVENSPVPTTYGRNRVLGTIGWALFALMVGFLIDSFSPAAVVVERDFKPAFIAFGTIGGLGFIATFFLKKMKIPDSPEKLAVTVGRSIWTFDVLLFCYGTFVAGINSGLLYGYLAWYMTELNATNFLVGIMVFVQAVYEAPMMYLSGWIIGKVGYHNCMQMCLLSFGIRFLGYYAMLNPWFVLLIDVVHSVGFGLFYAAITNFAFDNAPEGTTATLQGVLGATYEGIGQGIGGVAAGFLYKLYGGKLTWLGYGIFSFAAAVIYAMGQIAIRLKICAS